METNTKQDFRYCGLASGLLTREQIDEARGKVRARERELGMAEVEPDDAQLADELVDMGVLTRYQAEQLLGGRTTFELGPYQVIDSLGRGGMGHVFKAEHRVMGRLVAIKVLPRHKSNPETEARFLREIRTQAQLDDDNLVRALDAGRAGNVSYLVTEYVPGFDLRKLVRTKGRLSVEAAATIITHVARGLGHAHERGLVHRDVKPGNVLVPPNGRAKLSDLGLVGYFTQPEEADEATIGKIVGTADYLPPEQILSPEKVGPVSDIYGLGCTLYYAVTGKVPFPGGTTRDKANKHCKVQPLDPRRLNPELPDEFVDLLADMMIKDPARRVQTAEEVIERLAPWYDESWRLEDHTAAAGKPPVLAPPPRTVPKLPDPDGSLSDTHASFIAEPIVEPSHQDVASQVSQATNPVASADEETESVGRLVIDWSTAAWQRLHWPAPLQQITPGGWLLIGAIAAGGLVAMLALWTVFSSLLG